MKIVSILTCLFLMAILLLSAGALVTAQQPTATPFADVVVIPPTSSVIGDIINDPAVLTPVPTATYPNIPPPGQLSPGVSALVIAEPLNVRTAPDIKDGKVILQLLRGEDVTVLRVTADEQWALIDTRGPNFLTGWVSTDFIREQSEVIPFEATSVPLSTAEAVGTGLILRATEKVNIRANPVIFSPRVGLLPAGVDAEIIGRKSTYEWWKIRLNDGTVGWVSAIYVYIATPEAYQLAPVLVE